MTTVALAAGQPRAPATSSRITMGMHFGQSTVSKSCEPGGAGALLRVVPLRLFPRPLDPHFFFANVGEGALAMSKSARAEAIRILEGWLRPSSKRPKRRAGYVTAGYYDGGRYIKERGNVLSCF